MAGDAAERGAPDVTATEVTVAIHARVVFGLRVVEMDDTNVFSADVFFERVEDGVEVVFFAKVIAGGESVRCIEANAEIERGAVRDDTA